MRYDDQGRLYVTSSAVATATPTSLALYRANGASAGVTSGDYIQLRQLPPNAPEWFNITTGTVLTTAPTNIAPIGGSIDYELVTWIATATNATLGYATGEYLSQIINTSTGGSSWFNNGVAIAGTPPLAERTIPGGGATNSSGGGIAVLYDIVGGATGLEGAWDIANARVYPDTGAAAIAIGTNTNQATNLRFPVSATTTPLTAIANSTKILEVPEPGDATVAGSATIPFRPAANSLALSQTVADPNGIPANATAVSLTVWPDLETRNNLTDENQAYLAGLQLIYTIDGTTPSWGTADLAPSGTPLKYGDTLILNRTDALRLRVLSNSDTSATTPTSPGRPQITFYGLEGTAPQYPIYQAYEWSLLNNLVGRGTTPTTPTPLVNRSARAYSTTPEILSSTSAGDATIGSYSIQNDVAVAAHWVGFVEGNTTPTANETLFFATRNPGTAGAIINVGSEMLSEGKAPTLTGGFVMVRSTNPLNYVAAPALASNSFVSVNYAQ